MCVTVNIDIIVNGAAQVLFHLNIMNRNKTQNSTTIGASSLNKESFFCDGLHEGHHLGFYFILFGSNL